MGGFDPDLRYGEDVDLVWRLTEIGAVRYDPTVVVAHSARSSLAAMAQQRFGYGTAAAPLADRHGADLAPVRLSPWSMAFWLLVVARRPLLVGALGLYTAVALSKKLAGVLPDNQIEAVQLTARGHWLAGVAVAESAVRVWWPVTALLWFARWRRPVWAAVGLTMLGRAISSEGPALDRVRELATRLVDDAAYGAGVWAGAWRARSLRCLRPTFINWPGDDLRAGSTER